MLDKNYTVSLHTVGCICKCWQGQQKKHSRETRTVIVVTKGKSWAYFNFPRKTAALLHLWRISHLLGRVRERPRNSPCSPHRHWHHSGTLRTCPGTQSRACRRGAAEEAKAGLALSLPSWYSGFLWLWRRKSNKNGLDGGLKEIRSSTFKWISMFKVWGLVFWRFKHVHM